MELTEDVPYNFAEVPSSRLYLKLLKTNQLYLQ